MKTDFKLNHDAASIDYAMKDVPPEHQSMVKALFMTIYALGQPRQEGEKKKDEAMRIGFMLGTLGTLSIATPTEKIDNLSKNSFIVKSLLKLALDEGHIMAWAKAAQSILLKCENDKTKPKPKAEVTVMRMEKGDKKYTAANIDDLPDEVKDAIQEMIDKSCES